MRLMLLRVVAEFNLLGYEERNKHARERSLVGIALEDTEA